MTAPTFRALDQQTGEHRPSAFFEANAAADDRVAERDEMREEIADLSAIVDMLIDEKQQLSDKLLELCVENERLREGSPVELFEAARSQRDEARAELDNTMQSMRDLGSLVRDLTSQNAMWHAQRDEQRERADEWRDKAESYLATIDELEAEVRALGTMLAAAESQRDTARAAVSGF